MLSAACQFFSCLALSLASICFFILQSHYRQEVVFSHEALKQAHTTLDVLYFSLLLFYEEYETKLVLQKYKNRLKQETKRDKKKTGKRQITLEKICKAKE